MMPPAGAKRPDDQHDVAVLALVTALETRIDKAAARQSEPGLASVPAPEPRRVRAAVRTCSTSSGRHGVPAARHHQRRLRQRRRRADASRHLMEGYLRAASQISRLAVGDRNASATSVTYKIGRTMSQMRHVEGAPIGTRGGISVVHTFPADGEYVFKMNLHNEPLGGLVRPHPSMMVADRRKWWRSRSTASGWRCCRSTRG
jgi:hypothetical protein